MMRERRLALPAELPSVTVGRHFVRDVLNAWGLPGLVEDAELGASELVANAVRHAGTDLVLSVREDEEVVVAIQDGHPELRRPVTPEAGVLLEHGRGLQIVAAVSQDWGITAAVGGKVVWFSLCRPDAGRPDADVYSMARHRESRPASARRSLPAGSAGEPATEQVESRL